jgi:2-C-methyl-D-erythritol 4-phosphate cytidylyltransferase
MKKDKEHCVAIVLAAGSGKRMGGEVAKQYMEFHGYPLVYYSLKTFQESECVDEILLVTKPGDESFCQEEIVNRYHFAKVSRIVAGGSERYLSVYHALQQIKSAEYVMVHDAARPLLTKDLVQRIYLETKKWSACIPGVPVKDTIKRVNADGIVQSSLKREELWQVQTPQSFRYDLLRKAYDQVMEGETQDITDDAMVVERAGVSEIKMTFGDYRNIKVTTVEDKKIALDYLKEMEIHSYSS